MIDKKKEKNFNILTREEEQNLFMKIEATINKLWQQLSEKEKEEVIKIKESIERYNVFPAKEERETDGLFNYFFKENQTINNRRIHYLIKKWANLMNIIMKKNLPLVVSTAKKKYFRKGLEFNDIVHEGVLGVYRSIRKFDFRLGNKFSTPTTWWVRQRMSKAASHYTRLVRLPTYVITEIRRLAFEMVEEDDFFKMEKSLQKISNIPRIFISLNMTANHKGEEGSLEEGVEETYSKGYEESVFDIQKIALLRNLLMKLSPREERYIRMRYRIGFVDNYTRNEIGEILNWSSKKMKVWEDRIMRLFKRNKYSIGNFFSNEEGFDL